MGAAGTAGLKDYCRVTEGFVKTSGAPTRCIHIHAKGNSSRTKKSGGADCGNLFDVNLAVAANDAQK